MAFTEVLVDRARVLNKEKTAKRVEGTTIYRRLAGEWFRVRLGAIRSPATLLAGRERSVTAWELLYAIVDDAGEAVALTPDDRLEIESVDYGTAVWQIDQVPEVMRRKPAGSALGGIVQVRVVDEPGGG